MLSKGESFRKALSLLIILLIMVFNISVGNQSIFAAGKGTLINDINTDKSKYSPGEAVTVYVYLKNNTGLTITDGTIN